MKLLERLAQAAWTVVVLNYAAVAGLVQAAFGRRRVWR
jgi:hypothetical protein